MRTVLVRFSSLGDVVLCGAVTASLGEVCFVTSARYAGLVARFEGVQEVVALQPGEGVGALRARVPWGGPVVDLHGSLRSRALCLGRGAARLDRQDMARRTRVAFKRPAQIPPLVDRYATAAGVAVAARPWIRLERRDPQALGLVVGAAHAAKRWPEARWIALASGWDGPKVVFGGPDEAEVVQRVAAAIGAEPVAEQGFARTLDALARCRVVVGGDTGLLHLAAACGVPVVGLFGPTTSADGFWCHPGEAVEVPLPCRPCSRHGARPCPIGDHLCMEGLTVERVRSALSGYAAAGTGP
ncbi:MAG: glycosyltransferase family 9 protein [Alphaproteobacteria bacterium]|nr:glycosyltransferase family 9 protein [Alphaproteobacteria bacterium]